MRIIAGPSRDRRRQRGFTALLPVALLLAGLAVGGTLAMALVPRTQAQAQAREREGARLERIRSGLLRSIERRQEMPTTTNWSTVVAAELGMNLTEVEQVFPGFASDPTTRRLLLWDPSLGPGPSLLQQTVSGLVGSATNLMLDGAARMMLVSSSRRGLALPLANGVPAQADFDALWNWTYDPATDAPPAGWPAAWAGQGEFLHVERIRVANLFHRVRLENLQYSLNRRDPLTTVLPLDLYVLRGAELEVRDLAGHLRHLRVIRHDETLSLPRLDEGEPLYLVHGGVFRDEHGNPRFRFGAFLQWFLWVLGLLGDWWSLPWDGSAIDDLLNGLPLSVLDDTPPTALSLVNCDPGRDAFPGLLLAKGGAGPKETDPTKIQKWITLGGGLTLEGPVSLTLYTAMKDFNTVKRGKLVAYLVECSLFGTNPTTLATATLDRADWDVGNTGTWIRDVLDFGSVTRTLGPLKRLGVMIVVHPNSDDDMWFAYGTATYDSHLRLP